MDSKQQEYRELVLGYASGNDQLVSLPTGDPGFWLFAVVRAARPGRTSIRAPNLAIAAERLLRGPLPETAAAAKEAGLVLALRAPDHRVRRLAIHLMHEVPLTEAVLEAVSQATLDTDPEVRLGALILLAAKPTPASVQHFLGLLTETDDIRATVAADALVRIGATSVEGLALLIESPNAATRWRATRCLARIGSKTAEVPLIRAFHDDSPGVAWAAADGLLLLGPSVARRVLQSVLDVRLNAALIRALHHYAEHARPTAAFRKLTAATTGLAVGAATLTAVDETLKTLRGRPGSATTRL